MEPPPDHRDNLRVLYSVSASDLAAFKLQQWSVANYCLLLVAALVGIGYQLVEVLTPMHRGVLAVLVLAVVVSSVVVHFFLEQSISHRRKRLENIRHEFGDHFERIWDVGEKPTDGVKFLLPFAMIAAGSVGLWLIVVEAPTRKNSPEPTPRATAGLPSIAVRPAGSQSP